MRPAATVVVSAVFSTVMGLFALHLATGGLQVGSTFTGTVTVVSGDGSKACLGPSRCGLVLRPVGSALLREGETVTVTLVSLSVGSTKQTAFAVTATG